MLETRFSHLALLVPSVERASAKLRTLGCHVGPTEFWEGEGTKEIYVGEKPLSGLLLLMEPTKPGVYEDALKKRGPGLHHIAVDVLDLEGFVLGLIGTGWLLHPKSLATIKKTQTAWLARPGLPLIEVQQRESLSSTSSFVIDIAMSVSSKEREMMNALGLKNFVSPHISGARISMGKSSISIAELTS